jgi:hypothetical protein
MRHGGRGRFNSRVRESSAERSALAPTMKLSVSYVGNNARDKNKNF